MNKKIRHFEQARIILGETGEVGELIITEESDGYNIFISEFSTSSFDHGRKGIRVGIPMKGEDKGSIHYMYWQDIVKAVQDPKVGEDITPEKN